MNISEILYNYYIPTKNIILMDVDLLNLTAREAEREVL